MKPRVITIIKGFQCTLASFQFTYNMDILGQTKHNYCSSSAKVSEGVLVVMYAVIRATSEAVLIKGLLISKATVCITFEYYLYISVLSQP